MKPLVLIVSDRIDTYYKSLKSIIDSGDSITQTEFEVIEKDAGYLDSIDFYGDAEKLRGLLSAVKVRAEVCRGCYCGN